jgi:hypothetical protein
MTHLSLSRAEIKAIAWVLSRARGLELPPPERLQMLRAFNAESLRRVRRRTHHKRITGGHDDRA